MARSRKRSSGRRRMRADWVYRGEEYDEEGGVLATQVASYVAVTRTGLAYPFAVGTDVGVILYDSYDYFSASSNRANPQFIGKEARPQGPGPTILAVRGSYYLQPNTWTAGANWAVGARIIIADQNMDTGQMDLPANYRLPVGPPDPSVSLYANGWGNLAERVDLRAFATGNEQNRWQFFLNWRGRRKLKQHECLGVFFQSSGAAIGSTSMTLTPLFRTLVHDPSV